MKIISVETQVFYAETEAVERDDIHHEANSRFLQF